MIYEYVMDWIKAKKEHNKPMMEKIEKELRSLGMDRATLIAIYKDVEELSN